MESKMKNEKMMKEYAIRGALSNWALDVRECMQESEVGLVGLGDYNRLVNDLNAIRDFALTLCCDDVAQDIYEMKCAIDPFHYPDNREVRMTIENFLPQLDFYIECELNCG